MDKSRKKRLTLLSDLDDTADNPFRRLSLQNISQDMPPPNSVLFNLNRTVINRKSLLGGFNLTAPRCFVLFHSSTTMKPSDKVRDSPIWAPASAKAQQISQKQPTRLTVT